jgi:hypothetical protein
LSKSAGVVYWKGTLDLIDGSPIELLVLESESNNKIEYSIKITGTSESSFATSELYAGRRFGSARSAVRMFERDLNCELYQRSRR